MTDEAIWPRRKLIGGLRLRIVKVRFRVQSESRSSAAIQDRGGERISPFPQSWQLGDAERPQIGSCGKRKPLQLLLVGNRNDI